MSNPLDLLKSYEEFRDKDASADKKVKSAKRKRPARKKAAAKRAATAKKGAAQPGPQRRPATPPPPPSRAAAPSAPSAPRGATATRGSTEIGRELYDGALQGVSKLFEAAALEAASPDRLSTAIAELAEVAALLAKGSQTADELLARAIGPYPENVGFIFPHSVNVAVLAVHVGRDLALGQKELTDLCLAGLTHDIGSVRLTEGLLYKPDSLNPQEWEEIRRRPIHGAEILRALGDDYQRVAEIALQVYERIDGSGYPMGLKGEQILQQARILGAVDFFEAFAHPRPYKDVVQGAANCGVQTLMRMGDQFGRDVLKALVRRIGLFPVGTYVRMSNGEIGRVLGVRTANPMRPEVEVILDSKMQRLREPRQVDLVAAPHVYVARPLSASDMRSAGLDAEESTDASLAQPG